MKIYNFKPKEEELESRHWQASTYRGSCMVYADNEKEAIKILEREFSIAAPQPAVGSEISIPPWGNDDLVDISEVSHTHGDLVLISL